MAGTGGARAGAGRKPSTVKGLTKKLGKFDAELILAKINGAQKWIELAEDEDANIRIKALMYLTDRAYGKPKQALEHSGKDGAAIVFTLERIGKSVK